MSAESKEHAELGYECMASTLFYFPFPFLKSRWTVFRM